MSHPHPQMAQVLAVSQIGQLWPPRPIGEWFVIIRLEERVPVEFDQRTKQRLLDECFENWLAGQMSGEAK